MDESFWSGRWATGQIGFHQGRPHELLVKHHDVIALDRRVYVPLCGKTKDLVWLRDHGHEVTGCELVPQAVKQLFADESLLPTTTRRGTFKLHLTPRLAVLEGDALDVDVDVAGVFDAVYDRAALVALPPAVRQAYVDSLLRVLRPGGRALIVGFVYDQQKLDGPPFSVDLELVRALCADRATVVQIDERDEPAGPRFQAAGVSDLREVVFVVEKA
jgi:thiopurine S-methyltransferase